MRQYPQRDSQKAQRMNAAGLIDDTAREMLHQLSLPIEPTDTIKARRERAIRRAGLSAAKGMRLWYGQTCALLASEYVSLIDALERHEAAVQASTAKNNEITNSLRDDRLMREGHASFEFAATDRKGLVRLVRQLLSSRG
jgi:hypothetical protein